MLSGEEPHAAASSARSSVLLFAPSPASCRGMGCRSLFFCLHPSAAARCFCCCSSFPNAGRLLGQRRGGSVLRADPVKPGNGGQRPSAPLVWDEPHQPAGSPGPELLSHLLLLGLQGRGREGCCGPAGAKNAWNGAKNAGMLRGAAERRREESALCAGQISHPHSSSHGERRQWVYKVLGSGLHSREEKKQSSAQPCPLLTKAASCVGATSTRWPRSTGHGLPCRQPPRSWPGSAPHRDQGSKPALFSIGSSQLLLILKIHPLAPKPRRPAGIDAKSPSGYRDR